MDQLEKEMLNTQLALENGVKLQTAVGDDGMTYSEVFIPEAQGFYTEGDAPTMRELGVTGDPAKVAGAGAATVGGLGVGGLSGIAGLVPDLLSMAAGPELQSFADEFKAQYGTEAWREYAFGEIDKLDIPEQYKFLMKDAAMVGEVTGLPGAIPVAKGAAKLPGVVGEAVSDYAAGAPARLKEAQSGFTLGMNVDPTQMVDEAIVAGQKLMGKEPAPVPQAMPDVIDLSPEERSASLIDDLYDGETTLEAGGNLYDVAKRINERSKSMGARIEPTPENQTKIAKVMAREALHAMQSKGNAGDWYRQKVDNAMRIAERVYPEVAADPNKGNAIKFITAITSNGASVPENSKNTFAAFDEYLKTGKMPDMGFGKEGPAMKKAFGLHNDLVDAMGETEFYDFMSQEFTVRELDEIGKKYGFKISGEAKDTKLPASVIFGPKIGGGFYQNLQGNYKPLTMDRWFMRTWGRYTGGLIVEQTAEAAAKQMNRIRKSVTPEIAADYGYSYDDLMSDDILLEELAYRAHKTYVKSGYKDKTELNKSSKNFVEAQKKVLEQPRTGTERNYMRSTVDEALDILGQQGVNLDRAALQALIWYPEKELYAKLGIGTKRSAPTDYETEFANVARERGVDVSDIIGDAQP
jgi:hypothetical protein